LAQLTGVLIGFLPNLANTTTTPTLAVNSLAATTIVKCGTTALAANDLTTNAIAFVVYNGTNFQLQNPQSLICQAGASGNFTLQTNSLTAGNISATNYDGSSATANVNFYGGTNSSSGSALGSAIVHGGNNSGSGAAGNTNLEAGANSSTGQQGFANIQQSFTTASALAATFEAVSMTSTADQVQASSTGSVTNVGIAQTVGGTAAQLYVVSHGKTTARFDGTPVVGDVACYPLSGGTVGLLHDNGTTACTLGESAGVITGQVSGSGSGATATVEIR
jgi:hypothetical protein